MKKGFSLVELSIVLVILGLLVGGVLSGQALIRAAELRSIITEYDKYRVAISQFKDKYFSIPGDMINATDFWGSVSGDCNTVAGIGTETCNGNGSGIIDVGYEGFRFWQHLANAGLIEGSYTGIAGPNNGIWDVEIGTNIPVSKISAVSWSALSIVYNNNNTFPAIAGSISRSYEYKINQLHVGKESGNYWTYAPFLKPEELWNLDKKIDDGKPGTGVIVANNYRTCTTLKGVDGLTAASSSPDYDLASSNIGCAIIFMPKGTGL